MTTDLDHWIDEVTRRVSAEAPDMGEWEGLEDDMLSLLDMLIKEGLESKDKIKSLSRVGFGIWADVDVIDDRTSKTIILEPDPQGMVGLLIWQMKFGPHAGERKIWITLPELELQTIDGRDLGWAIWLRRQMPGVNGWYPH